MKQLYYEIQTRAYSHKPGVFYETENGGWPFRVEVPGEKMGAYDFETMSLELKDGSYAHYHRSTTFAKVVSPEFKSVVEEYNTDPSILEFWPVKITSAEYGSRVYYFLHFTRICWVNDEERSVYVSQTDRFPMKLVLDYDKIGGKSIFMTDAHRIIVDDEIRRALVRKKLTLGIELAPIRCSHVPMELQRKGYMCEP